MITEKFNSPRSVIMITVPEKTSCFLTPTGESYFRNAAYVSMVGKREDVAGN